MTSLFGTTHLNRAVHFAFAEELIIRREVQPTLDGENAAASPPYRIHLSPKGRELLKSIHAMDDCFEDLKQFLAAIPESHSEAGGYAFFRGDQPMTLRFRHLELRAVTQEAILGTNIDFVDGLNVLAAPNFLGRVDMCHVSSLRTWLGGDAGAKSITSAD